METEQEKIASETPRYFYTRDTSLPKPEQKPLVIKSVDVTGSYSRPMNRTVRFDYGFGGDGHLYVEVAVYKPDPNVPWVFHAFKVNLEGQRPESLEILAKLLGVPQNRIIEHVALHAPSLPS